MDLFVLTALIVDVPLDDFLVGVLPDRVHVKPTGPEVTAPENLLHLGMRIEDVLCREMFDGPNHAGGGEGGNGLEKKVDMILVCANFDEPDFVALLDCETDVFECLFHGSSQRFCSVLHRTDQVVQQERFVVALVNMITHHGSLHLRVASPHATCGVSRNHSSF